MLQCNLSMFFCLFWTTNWIHFATMFRKYSEWMKNTPLPASTLWRKQQHPPVWTWHFPTTAWAASARHGWCQKRHFSIALAWTEWLAFVARFVESEFRFPLLKPRACPPFPIGWRMRVRGGGGGGGCSWAMRRRRRRRRRRKRRRRRRNNKNKKKEDCYFLKNHKDVEK